MAFFQYVGVPDVHTAGAEWVSVLMDQTSRCKFHFLRRTAETMAEPGEWEGGRGLSRYLFKSANFVKLVVGTDELKIWIRGRVKICPFPICRNVCIASGRSGISRSNASLYIFTVCLIELNLRQCSIDG